MPIPSKELIPSCLGMFRLVEIVGIGHERNQTHLEFFRQDQSHEREAVDSMQLKQAPYEQVPLLDVAQEHPVLCLKLGLPNDIKEPE